MSYYDHKWQPWRTRGKATSVASMAVWERPRKWNEKQEDKEDRYEANCAASGGCEATIDPLTQTRVLLDVDMWDISSRILPDKSRIVWSVIDSTPALTWLSFTRHPHLIAQHWPPCVGHNVWLGVDVSTQREAEELIPALLKCRELCGRLVVRVTVTERIDVYALLRIGAYVAYADTPLGRYYVALPDWLILQGDIGRKAKPCNVAHVRKLVTQAREAGVPCWVERLGSRPEQQCTIAGCECRCVELRDPHGADPSEWPDDLRAAREVPT